MAYEAREGDEYGVDRQGIGNGIRGIWAGAQVLGVSMRVSVTVSVILA